MSSNGWETDLPPADDLADDHEPTPGAKLFLGNGAPPTDIMDIWGDNQEALEWMREWGVEAFRASKLHQLAVLEHDRQQKLGPLRNAYLKNGASKKK